MRTSWNKGLKMPPEWGIIRSLALMGHKQKDSTKALLSMKLKNRFVSKSSREKMSLKAKERKANKSPHMIMF